MQESNIVLRETGIFLRDYCTTLYSCGATTIRIDENMKRIAGTWKVKADFSILPTCMILSLWNEDNTVSYSITGKIPGESINFATITLLSALSHKICDNKLSCKESSEELRKISQKKSIGNWTMVFLASIANACFCKLFGGDLISCAIVFFATFSGFVLKQRLPMMGIDFRISIIAASCISSSISCCGFVFGIGSTPDIALATSVLYLIPGIPFNNSVADLLHGHYLCAVVRFIHAVVITFCLSFGLCISCYILNLKFI